MGGESTMLLGLTAMISSCNIDAENPEQIYLEKRGDEWHAVHQGKHTLVFKQGGTEAD